MDEEKQIPSGEDKKEVKVFVEVSRDKVEVYITLIPLSESPEFTTEQIRKALSDRGIKFGIKEEVIVLLEKDFKYNERLLIASGTKQKSLARPTMNSSRPRSPIILSSTTAGSWRPGNR